MTQASISVPLTVISLIFLVFSSIHFSRRIFSVALINSFNFLISCGGRERGREEMRRVSYGGFAGAEETGMTADTLTAADLSEWKQGRV